MQPGLLTVVYNLRNVKKKISTSTGAYTKHVRYNRPI